METYDMTKHMIKVIKANLDLLEIQINDLIEVKESNEKTLRELEAET